MTFGRPECEIFSSAPPAVTADRFSRRARRNSGKTPFDRCGFISAATGIEIVRDQTARDPISARILQFLCQTDKSLLLNEMGGHRGSPKLNLDHPAKVFGISLEFHLVGS